MLMAAKSYKVFAALEIRLPPACARVVTKVKVLPKGMSEIFVVTVIGAHM
jgi:hypothetical protein